MKIFCSVLLIAAVYIVVRSDEKIEIFLKNLLKGKEKATQTLHHLLKEWDVKNYPNFLESGGLSDSSWTLMKLKLQQKILSKALLDTPVNWIVSFTGSSVTAGRDSPVNKSVVAVSGQIMQPVFAEVGITFRSIQNAMEANPCMPYDLCVQAFAGQEADMVHWEQSYNCGEDSVMAETFIRQAMNLKSKPIILFSHSVTENWDKKDCDDKKNLLPYVLTDHDRQLLQSFQTAPRKVFTQHNKKRYTDGTYNQINSHYKASGLQVYYHNDYKKAYQCRGPYVHQWASGNAGWHPSVLGHRLRASHHAVVWISVFKDAVSELLHLTSDSPAVRLSDLQRNVSATLEEFWVANAPLPAKKLHETPFADGITCWNNYAPRSDTTTSLTDACVNKDLKKSLQSGQLESDDWLMVVADRIYYGDGDWMRNQKIGYLDHKEAIIGSSKSGVISFKFQAKQRGRMFVCEVACDWGRIDKKFTHLWDHKPKFYRTPLKDDEDGKLFNFDEGKATAVNFERFKRWQGDCMMSEVDVPEGKFVFSILPTFDEKKLFISTILVP